MSAATDAMPDSGLTCLAMLARFFEKPCDYNQLRHSHGDLGKAADEVDLLRHAKGIGFKASALALQHIQPGKPQQNAYVERSNRTVRHEWLGQYIFETISEVQDYATEWLWSYNNDRPNMGIGGITPAQKLKSAA